MIINDFFKYIRPAVLVHISNSGEMETFLFDFSKKFEVWTVSLSRIIEQQQKMKYKTQYMRLIPRTRVFMASIYGISHISLEILRISQIEVCKGSLLRKILRNRP